MSTKDFRWLDRNFIFAIAEHSAATGGDVSASMNRALRNVGYKAAQFTPKESPSKIDKDLRRDKIGLKIATTQLRGRIGKSFTTKKGKSRTINRVTRKQIAKKTRELFNKRKKRRGLLRAGWIAALIAAGVKGVRGGTGDLLKGGRSKLGTGRMATPQQLYAYLGNAVWGRLDGPSKTKTEAKMMKALQRAMRYVAADMVRHAQSKMSKTGKKYSGRKKR